MQLVEEPKEIANVDAGVVKLMPVLDPTVQVLREQEAYPLLSLVADIGGILGLFTGFNFLMIFDWIVLPFKLFADIFNTQKC